MKETCNSQVSTADFGRKRKKRKGGTNFNTSKQRRRKELRKKETSGVVGLGASNKDLDLEPIEEEGEHNRSRAPSMAESEHRTNSSKSGSEEETKEDAISTVSLS